MDNEYSFRRKHAYYYQIQFQMYVTGVEWADFVVVWSASEVVVLYIARDDDFLSKVVPKLTFFYFNCLLPALVAEASSEIRVN